MPEDPLVFALSSSRDLGHSIAHNLGIVLAEHEEREFEGGEHKARPLVEVGGREVYVVHSLQGQANESANDKLVRLLFFIGALKSAGAAKVTAIAPYLAYTRKDRRTKPRDPVSSRYIATLFEAVGTDRLITLDVHNISAFENAFRACLPEHLALARVFAESLAPRLDGADVAVVSPDTGGDKRAELFRHELERILGRSVGKAIMDKHRSAGVVSGELFAGDVAGCTAIIIDDIISSGGTIMRACRAARKANAQQVIAVSAHAMFTARSPLFEDDGPDLIVVSDTIPLLGMLTTTARAKIEVVEAGPLIAEVIKRLHSSEPVSDCIPYD